MHLQRFLLPAGVVLCLLLSSAASAESIERPAASDLQPSAVITGPTDIPVDRTIVLDASSSHTTGEKTTYTWSIDETKQIIGRGVEAIYTPEKPGQLTFRLVIRSTGLDGKVRESTSLHPVVAFKRKIVVIADASVEPEELQAYATTALAAGVHLRIVQPQTDTSNSSIEDALSALLGDNKDAFTNAEAIVIWTDGISGLQALIRSTQGDADRAAQVRNSSIILFSGHSLSTVERTVQGAFSVLRPREILITRPEALGPLIEAKDQEGFVSSLRERGIDTSSISSTASVFRVWNVLSMLVNYLLSHGVSGHTVLLLLMLPVIATVFSFLKQVIGITTFGLYTPTIIALSFLSLGWLFGFLFLILILAIGYLTRSLMGKWRLLYIPKVAIILTTVSITLLVLVALGTAFGQTFTRDTVILLLILSTLSENFLSLKSEEGWLSAVTGVGETVLGSLLCVLIVQWEWFQTLILAYPELILLTIVINAYLGTWTGLRLVEYFRFREVLSRIHEE